jgi:hypothetical protein
VDKVTVAQFETWPDAAIARGLLESEGIEAWLMDENLVQLDWLYTIAVGGIKVQVQRRDEAKARAVLAADHSAALDDFEEDDAAEPRPD